MRIGVSGWRYAPWRGVFYPKGLPQHAELRYAASRLTTVEINGSFYSLQRPEAYERWRDETPHGFTFAVKGPRFITHMKKLRECEKPLANFLASGVLALGPKLGPLLWQFPEQVRFEPERFARFLELLPKDTEHALAVARRRDTARMRGRARLSIDAARPLRHAFEIRSPTFLVPEFVELLRAHGAALVVAETAGRFPMPADVTADFVYLRLHGDQVLYRSGYSEAALQRWAERIRAWHAGSAPRDVLHVTEPRVDDPPRDVYCYFDNTDDKLRAPFDAERLAALLGVSPKASIDGAPKASVDGAPKASIDGALKASVDAAPRAPRRRPSAARGKAARQPSRRASARPITASTRKRSTSTSSSSSKAAPSRRASSSK